MTLRSPDPSATAAKAIHGRDFSVGGWWYGVHHHGY